MNIKTEGYQSRKGLWSGSLLRYGGQTTTRVEDDRRSKDAGRTARDLAVGVCRAHSPN